MIVSGMFETEKGHARLLKPGRDRSRGGGVCQPENGEGEGLAAGWQRRVEAAWSWTSASSQSPGSEISPSALQFRGGSSESLIEFVFHVSANYVSFLCISTGNIQQIRQTGMLSETPRQHSDTNIFFPALKEPPWGEMTKRSKEMERKGKVENEEEEMTKAKQCGRETSKRESRRIQG